MEGGGELDRSAVVQSLQLGNPKEDVIRTLRELSYQGGDAERVLRSSSCRCARAICGRGSVLYVRN